MQDIIFNRVPIGYVKSMTDAELVIGIMKEISKSRKRAFKYRKQYLDPWEIHEAQRKEFFKWLEVKRND